MSVIPNEMRNLAVRNLAELDEVILSFMRQFEFHSVEITKFDN